jgi:YidC/Oxa1 family membrane protein insertase
MMSLLQPIINVLRHILVFFYGFTHDYTLSIVLLTLVVKLVLHPLTRTQLKSMRAMQLVAPHIEALRRKHKDDPKTLNQEMMALYRAHNVNPAMGCLPMLVQLPILWGLFRLLYTKDLFGGATVLGLPWLRLDDIPNLARIFAGVASNPLRVFELVFPVLAGVSTWWQQKMSVTDPQQARMLVVFPIMTAYFATLYPIGLSIYWIVSTFAYIAEFFIVVGRPHPMAAAPPKSQAGRPAAAVGGPGAAPRSKKGEKRA